jgi:hypothetical protein
LAPEATRKPPPRPRSDPVRNRPCLAGKW